MTFLGLAKGVGGFALRHWVWFAMAAAILAANHYRDRGTELETERNTAIAERDTAKANADAWSAAHDKLVELSRETAQARAAETQTITVIRDAAGTAREEIHNAPGADDRFDYSDPAYRFMRARPEADGDSSAPASDVGGG